MVARPMVDPEFKYNALSNVLHYVRFPFSRQFLFSSRHEILQRQQRQLCFMTRTSNVDFRFRALKLFYRGRVRFSLFTPDWNFYDLSRTLLSLLPLNDRHGNSPNTIIVSIYAFKSLDWPKYRRSFPLFNIFNPNRWNWQSCHPSGSVDFRSQ